MYSIHYWEEGNGIIRYEYVVKPSQTLVLFAVVIAMCTAYSLATNQQTRIYIFAVNQELHRKVVFR